MADLCRESRLQWAERRQNGRPFVAESEKGQAQRALVKGPHRQRNVEYKGSIAKRPILLLDIGLKCGTFLERKMCKRMSEKDRKLEILYDLLETFEKAGRTDFASALRWAIFQIENM